MRRFFLYASIWFAALAVAAWARQAGCGENPAGGMPDPWEEEAP